MSVRWKSLGWSSFLVAVFLLKICLASQQGKFLVITDFHLDNQYNRHGNRSKMCHRQAVGENETPKSSGSDELGPYGERICDSPPVCYHGKIAVLDVNNWFRHWWSTCWTKPEDSSQIRTLLFGPETRQHILITTELVFF